MIGACFATGCFTARFSICKASYCAISWIFEAGASVVEIIESFWNLTCGCVAVLWRNMSKFQRGRTILNMNLVTLRDITIRPCIIYLTVLVHSWWRHQMETFSAFLALFCGEFADHRCISRTKSSDAELWCFRWSAPEPTVEQTMATPVIWDAIALIMTSL